MASTAVAGESGPLRASDLIAVRSRVSWAAIVAGAMVALTIYVLLMLLGVAVGIEVAARAGEDVNLGTGSAFYTIAVLAIAMFFGGWASSRLAVGEDRLEAVLHALILWGLLFFGMVWLVSSGVRVGFSALMGVASGTYTVATDAAGATEGGIDADRLRATMREFGVPEDRADKAVAYYRDFRDRPVETARRAAEDPEARQAAATVAEVTRRAVQWTLTGVIISLLLVVVGGLVGAGEVPVPVPLGVMRRPARA